MKVAGNWDKWKKKIPLKYDPVNNVWEAKTILNHGRYLYKFLVDNDWEYREALPYIEDAKFNINNVIDV